ncbi:MAG TPA: dienelactone hydrolase family protein [Fimbriimonadaceae bacterium]|nr:dienelactone hydrolase family protein [Fimbriimonadaceae bacterium]
MKLCLILLALAALSCATFAQDWAKAQVDKSPRHLEWVELKHGSRTVRALVAYPEVNHPATVVVLIHEIFGMSDWAMLTADQLAAEGYIVIAPDFLSQMGPNGGGTSSLDPSEVRSAMSALPPDQVDADLQAACDYGKKIPSANGKIVVGGFCWGGSTTFRFATRRTDLSAALVFYGTAPSDDSDLKKINCPVYGFYGGDDFRVSSTIPETEKRMKALGKPYDPVIYEGAGHGFMRSGIQPEPEEANAKARAEAWKRALKILAGIG